MKRLENFRVAILCTDGVEQSELIEPRRALLEEGAEVDVISPKKDEIQIWRHDEKADRFPVDHTLSEADAENYDALVLPGGVMNPDQLRMNTKAVEFVRAFIDQGKPVAAICHGPWTLIEANGVRNKSVTSWPSLKTDLKNAGGHWSDVSVAVAENLVTSRKPDDLPDFNREMVKMFSQRMQAGAQAMKHEPTVAPSAQI